MKDSVSYKKILKACLIIIALASSIYLISCQTPEALQDTSGLEEIEAGSVPESLEKTANSSEETAEAAISEGEIPDTPETPDDAQEAEETWYNGICENAYFPVKEGVFRKYEVNSPSDSYEYVTSFLNIASSFMEKIESSVFNADINWTCLLEGLIQSEYSALMLEEDDEGMEFATESYEGITIPSGDKWNTGYKWDTGYKVKTTITVEGERMSFDGDIIIKNEIVSMEAVTVPAGTFPEAYKVNSAKSMNISADMGGITMKFDVFTDILSWYAENTGLVKQTSRAKCGTTTVELLSLEE